MKIIGYMVFLTMLMTSTLYIDSDVSSFSKILFGVLVVGSSIIYLVKFYKENIKEKKKGDNEDK